MKSIKNKLTLATCSLLSQQSGSALAIDNAWEIDSSALYYSEADNRVEVGKFVTGVAGDVSDTDRVNISVVLDTMSGSTPSGAVKNKSGGNTTSGASGGGGSAVTDPNASALVNFDDTRLGNDLNWSHLYDNNWSVDYSGSMSIENDYRSFGVAATINKETESKNDRFTFGVSGTFDKVWRVGAGSTPNPLTQIADNDFRGKGDKDTYDVILGLTHVINRRTTTQVNLTYSNTRGYLTDPYKLFSVVDKVTNRTINDSSYYEKRPGSRNRGSILFALNHQLFPSNDVLHGSYRFYTDDWGVDSHTVDTKYRFNLADTNYIETSLRLYHQSEADFYHNQFFVDNVAGLDPTTLFPKHISADYRLDQMYSVTPGIRYGRELGKDGSIRARVEYMYQSFDNSEFGKNKAIILQIAYSKRF